MNTLPKIVTSHNGILARKPTSPIAVLISSGQRYRRAGQAAQTASHRADDPGTDRKQRGHNVHPIGHSRFCRDKPDKIAQCVLRPAEVLKIRRTAKNTDGKEQRKLQ